MEHTHTDLADTHRHLHLDLTVSVSNPKRDVLLLLEKLRPKWRPEDIKFKFFSEGITNQLLGCYVDSLLGDVVLVRLYGKMTELFLDRQKELETFQVLHAHKCGPQLYCSFRNGICYQFMPGEVMDHSLLNQPLIYRLIAKELARIHSIKAQSVSAASPVLWRKTTQFLELVKNMQNEGMPDEWHRYHLPCLDVLACEIESLKTHLSQSPSRTVLCHNDLLIKNIIYNRAKGSVCFIDYEYADYNYQAYDIANHFNEYAGVDNVDYSLYPGQELQKAWLTTYLYTYKQCVGLEPSVAPQEVQELYVQVCKFSLVSHISWGLWALLQARYSSVDFDFLRYATARFNYYFKKKEEYFAMKLP